MPAKKALLKRIRFYAFLPLLAAAFFVLGIFLGTKGDLSSKLPSLAFVLPSETLSAGRLKDTLSEKDFTLINVHTPYEGEIEKTDLFIPFDEIVANRKLLPQDKSAKIVVYCKTGRMSKEALRTLKGLGYKNVMHLSGGWQAYEKVGGSVLELSSLSEKVLPEGGFTLPISWGDIGPRLISAGVIDLAKFEKAVSLTEEQKEILTKGSDSKIKIDHLSGQFVVDMLWALGLAQKSLVYEEGPLGQEYKDKVGNFASTGGWSLAKGDAVNYLNRYDFIALTEEQQKRVSEIAKGVYRPCCGNSTWFPDCNHGMAALAAIELLVSQGYSDEEVYKYVLELNSFWFPDTYLSIATYFARQGTDWEKVDARKLLSEEFSSAKGAQDIYAKVGPLPYSGGVGGSCGA